MGNPDVIDFLREARWFTNPYSNELSLDDYTTSYLKPAISALVKDVLKDADGKAAIIFTPPHKIDAIIEVFNNVPVAVWFEEKTAHLQLSYSVV